MEWQSDKNLLFDWTVSSEKRGLGEVRQGGSVVIGRWRSHRRQEALICRIRELKRGGAT